MSTDIRRTHPRYADQLRRDAGKALRSTAEQGKVRARVFGLNRSHESRLSNGIVPGVVGKFFEYIAVAVVEDKAVAGEMLARAMAVAEEAAVSLGLEEVERRWLRYVSQEQVFQSREDVATHEAFEAMLRRGSDLRRKLEAQDDALCGEGGREFEVIYLNRAYRRLRGWREGPRGVGK